MSNNLFQAPDGIRAIPPYRGIVAVDVHDYSPRPSAEQRVIAEDLERLLEASFVRVDLADVWNQRVFHTQRGDGYSFGFDPGRMPEVIGRWLAELQNTLSEIQPPALQVRLRAALHIGSLPADGRRADGSGAARNETARLLNAAVLKRLLAEADPDITRVVAVLSGHCYEVAVLGGHALHPGHFREVSAIVREKGFEQRAWIHVPQPSANLLDGRLLSEPVANDGEQSVPAAPQHGTSRTINSISRGNLNTGTIHGDQAFHG